MGTENLQELFDISLNHIRKQREPSVDHYGVCLYRGPNGTQCAAGPFVKDGAEETLFVDLEANDYIREFTREEVDFIGSLQHCHDNAYHISAHIEAVTFLEVYEEGMEKVATEYGLEYTKATKEP